MYGNTRTLYGMGTIAKQKQVSVMVRGGDRIALVESKAAVSHLSESGLFNQAFDALLWKQEFERLCCVGVSPADAFNQLTAREVCCG